MGLEKDYDDIMENRSSDRLRFYFTKFKEMRDSLLKRWLPLWITLIIFGIILFVDYLIDKKVEDFSSYMNLLAGLATLGALLSFLHDRELAKKSEDQKYLHSYMPFLMLSSPCDPTQNYCDINILDNKSDYTPSRGNIYFSVPNFSNATAYNLKIEFGTKKEFLPTESKCFFIDVVPITQGDGNNLRFVYSKFNISPDSKEILLDEFDLCGFASNCSIAKERHKELFAKLSYHSSPNSLSPQLETTFKVTIECYDDKPEGLNPEATKAHTQKVIRISSIVRIGHRVLV